MKDEVIKEQGSMVLVRTPEDHYNVRFAEWTGDRRICSLKAAVSEKSVNGTPLNGSQYATVKKWKEEIYQ